MEKRTKRLCFVQTARLRLIRSELFLQGGKHAAVKGLRGIPRNYPYHGNKRQKIRRRKRLRGQERLQKSILRSRVPSGNGGYERIKQLKTYKAAC